MSNFYLATPDITSNTYSCYPAAVDWSSFGGVGVQGYTPPERFAEDLLRTLHFPAVFRALYLILNKTTSNQ